MWAYRNYTQTTVEFNKPCVVLYGPNGAGKTNLLEAVSLLSPGRGLRRATYSQICQQDGAASFIVNASLCHDAYGIVNIGTGLRANTASRQVHINAEPCILDELTHYCRVLWLTPLMDRLFIGPQSDRRRFLDRLVLAIDPRHGARVRDYEKMMRSRNYILQESYFDEAGLTCYEDSMAELAVAIALARNSFVALLSQELKHIEQDSFLIQAAISIKGDLEHQLNTINAEQIVENMRKTLRDNRAHDRAQGRCSIGPQRSDFCIKHAQKAISAELCSSGEQKALLLNIILAQAQLTHQVSGMFPIMLLDEIGAYLDPDNKTALLSKLQTYGGQTIITTTDISPFNTLNTLENSFQAVDICSLQQLA